jgi:hypothetical protein
MSSARSGPVLVTLLALRFVVELGLFAAPVAVAWSAVGGVLGVGVGVLASALVATLWGLVLSPRRRFDPPLAVRVALELLLMTAAVVGLLLTGHTGWAVALAVGEVIDLAGLALLGIAPGTDVGGPGGSLTETT